MISVSRGGGGGGMMNRFRRSWSSGAVLVSTVVPPSALNHALVSGSFTDSNWCGLFVFSSESSRLASRQSLVGTVRNASFGSAMPVQFIHVLKIGRAHV